MPPPNPTPTKQPRRYDVGEILSLWFGFVVGIILIIAVVAPWISGKPLADDRADMVFDLIMFLAGALTARMVQIVRRRRKGAGEDA